MYVFLSSRKIAQEAVYTDLNIFIGSTDYGIEKKWLNFEIDPDHNPDTRSVTSDFRPSAGCINMD